METFYYIKSAEQVANLQLILEETARAKLFWKEYQAGKTKRPGVWIVKDSGAYVMSAACPVLEGVLPKLQRRKPTVAYVDGFGKTVSHSKQQAAWGGDDFCFLTEVAPEVLKKIRLGAKVASARIRVEKEGHELTALAFAVAFVP